MVLRLIQWCIGFDTRRETPFIHQVWVMMPSLPMKLWSKEILEKMDNNLGRFIALKEKFWSMEDKRIVKILVEHDLHEGHPIKIDVEWGSWKYAQNLYY